jgi:DNA repair exonuclease SbcCD ATPase subunit
MEQKDLKKLTRSELLEMLLDRSKEVEHLRKQLTDAQQHIEALEQEIENSGRINEVIGKLEQLVGHE